MKVHYYLLFKRLLSPANGKNGDSVMLKLAITTMLIFSAIFNSAFAAPAASPDISKVEIRLELNNKSLLDAFAKIEAQTSFRFMYRKEDVKDVRNITISSSKKSISEFLTRLFQIPP